FAFALARASLLLSISKRLPTAVLLKNSLVVGIATAGRAAELAAGSAAKAATDAMPNAITRATASVVMKTPHDLARPHAGPLCKRGPGEVRCCLPVSVTPCSRGASAGRRRHRRDPSPALALGRSRQWLAQDRPGAAASDRRIRFSDTPRPPRDRGS